MRLGGPGGTTLAPMNPAAPRTPDDRVENESRQDRARPDDAGGRRWRRRPEQAVRRAAEQTAAAERAATLRHSAELAAAEQAAERMVAEESARDASVARAE